MTHQAFASGNTAVITGGANGIGLAAAMRLAGMGLNVAIADLKEDQLAEAERTLKAVAVEDAAVLPVRCDVSSRRDVEAFAGQVAETFGDVHVLMNNAGIGLNPGKPWENPDGWEKLLSVNLWGVVNGTQAFVPSMLAHGGPGLVINTGSKQGITKPPGNAAYNLSKAAVISFTESLAHEFRELEGCALTAHLLVPGFTYSSMIASFLPEKPPSAWTCEEVVDFMLERLETEDFYILCPDHDVTREMDQKRIQWYADDLIKNRPALSRWHKDYLEAFEAYMKEGSVEG